MCVDSKYNISWRVYWTVQPPSKTPAKLYFIINIALSALGEFAWWVIIIGQSRFDVGENKRFIYIYM